MIRYGLVIVMFIFLSAFIREEQGIINCNPHDRQVTINQLRRDLVGGVWQYSHSVFKDTCFVIAELSFLPKYLAFENRADSTFIKNKDWLAGRPKSYFHDIACTIIENGTGDTLLTFPSGSGKFSPDSLIDGYPMFHLPDSKHSGMTRKCTYDLLSVDADTMITRTGIVMEIRGKGEWNIHHIFYRMPLK